MPLDPLVSVIIPAYNAEATLGAALSSVLTQTYGPTEIVVCSDGSTDATEAIARAYGDRVRLIRQDNAGVAAARNAAMAAATGDLFALLDADDVWLPDYLRQMVTTWRDAGGGRRLVTATAYFLTAAGIPPKRRVIDEVIPPDRQRMRALEGPFVTGFAVFPRQMYVELGGFDVSLRTAEDYDFWVRAVFAGYEVFFQMAPQALYRRTGATLSQQVAQMATDEATVLRRLLDRCGADLSVAERDRIQHRLASDSPLNHIARGEAALAQGDSRAAAREFSTAASLLPSNVGLRRKAALLRAPLTGRALTTFQARRHRET